MMKRGGRKSEQKDGDGGTACKERGSRGRKRESKNGGGGGGVEKGGTSQTKRRTGKEEIDAERNEGGEGEKRIALSRPQQRERSLRSPSCPTPGYSSLRWSS